jgi:erythromycin esterase
MRALLCVRAAGRALAAVCSPIHLSAQRPLNLDFEQPSVSYPDRPWGWTLGWSAFSGGPAAQFALDSTWSHRGAQSLRIVMAEAVANPQQMMLQIPAGFARGRNLELRAWMRTSHLRGASQVMLEAWGDRVVIAADTATASASTDWREHILQVRVPDDSTIHAVVVLTSLSGTGSAWFDDLELRVDGVPIVTVPGTAPAPTATELATLLPYASPLLRVTSGAPRDDHRDLDRVDRIIEGASIVGLGESTHGTREFFQAKDRILRHLVQRHGFRLFAIEANQLAAERINRYVQGGEGSARLVARAMFAVWNTEEVATLIDWIRAYNHVHPDDPVRFAGYDMQDHHLPIDSLQAFLRRVEPSLVSLVENLTREYRAQPSYATYHVADSMRLRWAVQADSVLALVSRRRSAWLAAGQPASEVEWAHQAANLFQQAARFNVELNSPDRDSLMAVNVDWLMQTVAPGVKTVVWAHDVHISHGGDPVRSFNAGAQMGAHLKRAHGDRYRALSLLTHEGQYTATRSFTDHVMMAVDAFDAPAGSMEEALHRLPRPSGSVGWIVDLRAARASGALPWLEVQRPIRHVGYAAYDYAFELTAVLPMEFDGIIFVDHTSASRLLPRTR